MSGRKQDSAFIRAHRDPSRLPTDRFEYASDRSGKVRCVLCHRDGWGTIVAPANQTGFDGRLWRWHDRMNPWQIDCLQDHPWPCSCGRTFRTFFALWMHVGAVRPSGWGRQGVHEFALFCEAEKEA